MDPYIYLKSYLYKPSQHILDIPNIFKHEYINGLDAVMTLTNKKKIIIIFHGNGGNLYDKLNLLHIFYKLNISAIVFDYNGYGLSKKIKFSEKQFIKDGMNILDYVINKLSYNKKKITLWGESMGSIIASHVAYMGGIHKLICISSFPSLEIIIKDMFKNLQLHHKLVINKYLSTKNISEKEFLQEFISKEGSFDLIKNINNLLSPNNEKQPCNIIIYHSKDDKRININIVKKSLKNINNEKYKFYITNGSHNNPLINFDIINKFIKKK